MLLSILGTKCDSNTSRQSKGFVISSKLSNELLFVDCNEVYGCSVITRVNIYLWLQLFPFVV